MYRCLDAVLMRAATHPGGIDLQAWPALADGMDGNIEQWRGWLERVWSKASFAEAIAVASPGLARQVRKACDGHCRDPREMRRTVVSVARYVLRMTGRSTPFGLFAGVAAAGFGPRLTTRWGEEHRPVVRPDAAWLAAVVTSLEMCPELLRRLPVVVNNLFVVRGNRLIAPFREQLGDPGNRSDEPALADVSVRHTRAVEAVMRYAHSPIVVSELAGKLACDFPRTSAVVIEGMIVDLVRLALLLTRLWPPMTVTDALGHVVAQLSAVDADAIPQVADRVRELRAIRAGIASHNAATSSGDRHDRRVRLAEQMGRLSGPSGQPITVDLRLDTDLVLPEAVAREAEAAASALTRLTPYPEGLPAWVDFHTAFMERYGIGAVVPLLELVSPDTGLGFPATYRGSDRKIRASPLSDRDERLLGLVQRTVMGGGNEIVLDDRMISELTGESAELRQVPPHVELFVQIHAASTHALQRGAFELLVTGAARAAGATTGRFLDLLDPSSRHRFREAYAGLSTLRPEALPVQVSCPPIQARSGNLARAPVMLPDVVSVAQYRESDDRTIPLDGLAVGADADGLYLVSLTKQRLIEPTVLNSVEFRYFSHPLARFLCEIPRARAAVYMPFSWGAASSLPFLPRIRYGRAVLAPARWNLSASDLPGRSAPWSQWREGMVAWRRQFRLPGVVSLVEADNLLRLDLDQDMDAFLLRSHLDRHGRARLDEAPDLGAYGWLGGRAHEVVVPLTSTISAPTPPLSLRTGRILAIGRDHGHLPGSSTWLYAKLYSPPDRHAELLAHMLDLLSGWDSPPEWWYVPYLDPEPHLRLRLRLPSADAYGPASHRLGAWATGLRNIGLLGRLQLDTYYPETGRYGSEEAMAAAEAAFAADSAVALVQRRMAAQAVLPLDAVTVAGLVDLAVSFAGTPARGMRWLIDEFPQESVHVERVLHDTATRLADPRDGWAVVRAAAGGESVLQAWRGRRTALTAYRERLATQREPLSVLPSLLHMHHVRMLGVDPERERIGRRLARAAALRWTATTAGSAR